MRKDITISGIVCHFKSSAAVPRMYRMLFRRDLFKDMSMLEEELEEDNRKEEIKKKEAEANGIEYIKSSSLPISSLEIFENIAYVMHKHGDKSQPNDIEEWIEQFEVFDIYFVFPEILEMWKIETYQEIVSKKNLAKLSEN